LEIQRSWLAFVRIINGPEICDGGDFGSDSCLARGFYGGTLTCNSSCDAVSDGTCDTAQCVAVSQAEGSGAVEEVTLDVTQGEVCYLVVDGYAGALAGYTIEVACDKQ
jgi:hypothetical protein